MHTNKYIYIQWLSQSEQWLLNCNLLHIDSGNNDYKEYRWTKERIKANRHTGLLRITLMLIQKIITRASSHHNTISMFQAHLTEMPVNCFKFYVWARNFCSPLKTCCSRGASPNRALWSSAVRSTPTKGASGRLGKTGNGCYQGIFLEKQKENNRFHIFWQLAHTHTHTHIVISPSGTKHQGHKKYITFAVYT